MVKRSLHSLKTYLLAAALVAIISVLLYYVFGIGSYTNSVPNVGSVDLFDSSQQPSVVGYDGFFSMQNPLAWFMFGAWFALLVFFIISLLNGHAKR